MAFWGLLGFEPMTPPPALRHRFTWVQRRGTQIHLIPVDQPVTAREGHVAVLGEDPGWDDRRRRVGCGRRDPAEGHRDARSRLGAARADRHAVRDLPDERQADAETGAVGSRDHPAAAVGDRDAQAALGHPGGDVHGAGSTVEVGVEHGVGDRLGERERDVGAPAPVHAQHPEGLVEPVSDAPDARRHRGDDAFVDEHLGRRRGGRRRPRVSRRRLRRLRRTEVAHDPSPRSGPPRWPDAVPGRRVAGGAGRRPRARRRIAGTTTPWSAAARAPARNPDRPDRNPCI